MSSKTITFIRHGQATHNPFFDNGTYDPSRDEELFDAPLTDLGRRQAEAINLGPMDLVVVSPLTRTLQTASLIFKDHTGPILVHQDVRETFFNSIACNRRRPLSELKDQFLCMTFGSEAGDDIGDRMIVENMKSFQERLKRFTVWLQERPEASIVVSHGNFLEWLIHSITGNKFHLVNCGTYTITL